MIDAILGIDVSKNTLDVSISSCTKVRTKEGVFETVHHQDRSIFYNQVEATKVVPNSGVGDCGKIARHKQLPSAATLVRPSRCRIYRNRGRNMVLTLERRGFIRRQPGTARSIELLVDPKLLPELL